MFFVLFVADFLKLLRVNNRKDFDYGQKNLAKR